VNIAAVEKYSLQTIYWLLNISYTYQAPPLVRVRAGDYIKKATISPRLDMVASAFECRLICKAQILPPKIVLSTFLFVASRTLFVAYVMVIFKTITANDFENT
jgi:hypothetical protein